MLEPCKLLIQCIILCTGPNDVPFCVSLNRRQGLQGPASLILFTGYDLTSPSLNFYRFPAERSSFFFPTHATQLLSKKNVTSPTELLCFLQVLSKAEELGLDIIHGEPCVLVELGYYAPGGLGSGGSGL